MFSVKRITIIAVLLLVIGFVGALFTYESLANGEMVEEEKTFNERITDIMIETDNSRIEIIPTDNNTTKVEFVGDNSAKSRYRFSAEVENGSLKVKVKEKILQFFNFDFMIQSPVTRVYLPEQDYHSLTAKTGNGKVMLENITADRLSAETVNGEVSIENLHTQTVNLKSVNGKIKARNIVGGIEGKVTNGSINIKEVSLDQPVNLESVNGKINVQVIEEPKNAEITVEVVNGRIDVFGENSQHTVFGDGENKIRFKTVNGGINVGY